MQTRPIQAQDYEAVLDADRRLYPTSSPLTEQVIHQWFSGHPQFGLIFTDALGRTIGQCIIVALTASGWGRLVAGELSESELDDGFLFNSQRDEEVGLHVYHIEKMQGWNKHQHGSFGYVAMQKLAQVLNHLDEERACQGKVPLGVCGFSSLAVSLSGINLFTTTFNCRERDAYVCQEFIMQQPYSAAKRLEVFEGLDQGRLEEALAKGYAFVTRARMLVLLPGDPSVVWSILNRGAAK